MDLAERYAERRSSADLGEFVQSVEAWVKSYTRNTGFDRATKMPIPALQGVILAAAKRLSVSPIVSQSAEGGEVRYDVFRGFNLAELSILNDYRQRAC